MIISTRMGGNIARAVLRPTATPAREPHRVPWGRLLPRGGAWGVGRGAAWRGVARGVAWRVAWRGAWRGV
eukprot:1226395-Prymnesium_polylepis.1